MRIALLSDIHANIQALDACLAHARAQQAERFVFLGDMVGYGADPGAVVERIMRLTEEGAMAIQGNHDAMAIQPPAEVRTVGDSTAAWTHRQLTPAQREWMAKLPLTLQQNNVLFVHASVNDPELWRYVYDQRAAKASLDAAASWPDVRYVFGGHVHLQTLYYRGTGDGLMAFAPQPGIAVPVPKHRQWLGTVGSVGQPRDGDTRAMYSLLDTERAQLTFHRVAYDHFAAASAIRRTGLPDFFADRLEVGR
ncbi:metallophosphoesterase family protein [Candidatus Aalborgicola defluviihabitans]|uniref:metallophosphoesterase family protein n=1 Tax=Candidatus Aalborgicola defluviihabitans TaxID=3386187 RepID=UPI001DEB0EEF|nr:metallophosphoesterase family protein [Burkholderiales bacterium]MBK6570530.1 metallophosphoesterase family protein [Burkholderiales bacterium]MBK7279528.1 metallophosphoesterase family protein [Burkholderiales bacterium]MBK7312777.1 metallophosphoesterase family protein [Burkholderiales bacterium]MBL0243593.1 metallophosphoesterase family protein [Rhodoferax sp.]